MKEVRSSSVMRHKVKVEREATRLYEEEALASDEYRSGAREKEKETMQRKTKRDKRQAKMDVIRGYQSLIRYILIVNMSHFETVKQANMSHFETVKQA